MNNSLYRWFPNLCFLTVNDFQNDSQSFVPRWIIKNRARTKAWSNIYVWEHFSQNNVFLCTSFLHTEEVIYYSDTAVLLIVTSLCEVNFDAKMHPHVILTTSFFRKVWSSNAYQRFQVNWVGMS